MRVSLRADGMALDYGGPGGPGSGWDAPVWPCHCCPRGTPLCILLGGQVTASFHGAQASSETMGM